MKTKELKALLTAVNSTGANLFKYPIGNIELTKKLQIAEERGLIRFDSVTGLWKERG